MVRFSQQFADEHEAKFRAAPTPDSSEGKERDLQDKIKQDLGNRRFYVIGSIFGRRSTIDAGCPDIIAAAPNGVTLWIECKAGKGKLSPQQSVARHVLLALGHKYLVVWSFKQYLEEIGKL